MPTDSHTLAFFSILFSCWETCSVTAEWMYSLFFPGNATIFSNAEKNLPWSNMYYKWKSGLDQGASPKGDADNRMMVIYLALGPSIM